MRNEIWLAISTLIIAINTIPVAASSKDAYLAETDSTVVVRDYIANMEYVNGVLERVNFEGGYIDMTGESPRYMYYVTDHLGNVRAVVDEDGNVCQVNHYYPYGDRIDDSRDISAEGSGNMRLFGGKEYSEDTGLHDFEARYDNTLFGRFTTLDPMAEKYYSVSPYSYCAGNPVNFVDPDGRDWYRNDDTLEYVWYDKVKDREGFTYIGGAGTALGEYESAVDMTIHDLCNDQGIYVDGFSFTIATESKGALKNNKTGEPGLLGEFLSGSGSEYTIFMSEHPYTKYISEHSVRGRNSWTLLDVFKKQNRNLIPQFLGSFNVRDYGEVKVANDSKSVRSLFYHIIPDNLNYSRSHHLKMGNTYQLYLWKEPTR